MPTRSPYERTLTLVERDGLLEHPALVEWVRALVPIAWVNPFHPGQVWFGHTTRSDPPVEINVDIRSADLIPRSWEDSDNKRIKSTEYRRMQQEMAYHNHLLSQWLEDYQRTRGWDPKWCNGKSSAFIQGIIDGRVVRVTIRFARFHP